MNPEEIINYYPVDERIASSGQPGRDQFGAIAADGYQAVINLALPDSRGALSDEGSIVSALEMAYFHIPVNFEAPHLEDLELFFDLMRALEGKRIWVHCAMNYRVSCFLYLYRKHVLGLPEEQAARPMHEIWQPQGAWQALIEAADRRFQD
jgi:protein tyrosine phosphatase (PTP) superfamily phosphohydrolase (DUF442 family)